jgi:cleavage and polyadenylation specificity factor subunit 1
MIHKRSYWRLAALRSVLANAVESHAALSPRSWRLYRRSGARGGCIENERKKGIVDGEVVLQYLDLPVSQQEELASAIGTTSDLIIDNILELEAGSIPC